jgi:hypothetical protein
MNKARRLKEGFKCSKNIDEIETDLKGWVKLLLETQGGQGKFISSKTTKRVVKFYRNTRIGARG